MNRPLKNKNTILRYCRDGQLAARGPHTARILTQSGPHIIKKKKKIFFIFYNWSSYRELGQERWEEFIEFKGKPMRLVCLERISVIKDIHISRHYNYYNCNEYHACWVWVHWVVALNVGPLFFSFVTSLNDDICEPFALITILTIHVAVWACKTWNELLVKLTYRT